MSTQPPKWNVMIFLAGNNSLSEECVYSLTEVLEAEIQDNIAVFAQLSTGVHRGTFLNLREFKNRDQLHKKLNAVLSAQHKAERAKQRELAERGAKPAELEHHNLSFSERIFQFVKKSVGEDRSQRAEHHMLILAGHGNGILGEFLREDDRDQDGNKSGHMNMINLGGLIKRINRELLDGKKIDILGMDSCLMSMTEIAYAVHNNVKVMIGAQGFEPMAGWPYHQVLQLLNKNGGDVNKLGKKIVDEYIEFYTIYQAANLSVDLAATNLSETVMVMKAIQSLATTLGPILEKYPHDVRNGVNAENPPDSVLVRDAVLLAHWEAQLYKNEQYTDIYDFCTLLKARLSPTRFFEVRRACQNVLNAVLGATKQLGIQHNKEPELADDNFTPKWSKVSSDDEPRWMRSVNFQTEANGFVLKSCYSGWVVQYSYGVSVYFPWSKVPADMEQYHQLNFAHDSRWADFLDVYLAVTKREARPGKGEQTEFATSFLRDNFSVAPTTFAGTRHAESNRHAESDRHAESNRSMTNMIGSMKNPATDFWECPEFEPPARDKDDGGKK